MEKSQKSVRPTKNKNFGRELNFYRRPTKMVLPTPYQKYDFLHPPYQRFAYIHVRPTEGYEYVLLKDMSTPY